MKMHKGEFPRLGVCRALGGMTVYREKQHNSPNHLSRTLPRRVAGLALLELTVH